MQRNILRLFYVTARKYPWRLWLAIVNSSVTSLIGSFAGPLIIAVLLDRIQAGTVSLDTSWALIATFVGAQLYGEVIGWRLNIYAAWTFQASAQRDLDVKIFNHLANSSMGFHANRFGGSLVSQTNKLVGSFQRFWDTIIFQIVPVLTSIVATTIILSVIFWQYAIVLFTISLIFILTVFIGSRHIAKYNKAEAAASNKQTGRLADMVTNILAVKSFGKEPQEYEEFRSRFAAHWLNKSLDTMKGFLAVSTIYSAIISVLNVSALVAAIWAVETQAVSIATVYLSVTYTFVVARQLWEMNSIMRNYNRVIGDAHEMTEILLLEPDVKDALGAQELIANRGDIIFDAVGFRHDGSGEYLFSSFDVHIKPGEKIGLVGPSGGGKTSLTKLLLRFMDIQQGSINIDGQDIAKVTQQSLRESIAYVPQEPAMFHRTIAENIAYSNPNASMEQIKHVAKMSHAHDFIAVLDNGYNTLVGERGVKLSGGQRQRIAIARALLKNAPILLLDEATSALDSENEILIQKALWQLMENRTSIVIAHRLSTIQKMDRILVLDEGTVVEEGTHKELLHKSGVYARLWSHQSGGFLDE